MWLFAACALAAAALIASVIRDEIHRRRLTKTAPAQLMAAGGATHRGELSNEHH